MQRKSIRLKHYDYSQDGAYFVTICRQGRKCLFGEIENGHMQLNECGRIVESEWLKTPALRFSVKLDEYIVMPNHFHAILNIVNGGRGVLQYAPTSQPFHSPSQTIGAIVRGFKSAVTKQINVLRNTPGIAVWQRNYYERVIRNENELFETRKYIQENPLKWDSDPENPNLK
jgi:REP element-mobilizing transposase RayT